MDEDRTLPGEAQTLGPPASSTNTTPRTLGRYTVLEALGRGAMGTVYAAYDPQLDRRVAVKLLHRRDDDANAALLAEAQALARLADPHVLTVHDLGTEGDQVFVAMEYVEGPTLSDWLRELPRPLSEADLARVLRVMIGAGRGLAAAHAAGLIHRDFKPHNVLLTDGERPLVADFGLAQPIELAVPSEDEHTGRAFNVVGTPAYMAPEVFEGPPPTRCPTSSASASPCTRPSTARVRFTATPSLRSRTRFPWGRFSRRLTMPLVGCNR